MSAKPKTDSKSRKFEKLFKENGGVLRTKDALAAGVHPRDFYRMESEGIIVRLSRGLFRLSSLPPLSNPDLVSVVRRLPQGVICLISALSFHCLTTQVSHEIHVAVARGTEPPRIDYPPVRIYWFGDKSFRTGVEEKKVDGSIVRVYSVEKTIADCFKYRNKVGLDIALEALKTYLKRKSARPDVVLAQAGVCRVERIVRPYLEALI